MVSCLLIFYLTNYSVNHDDIAFAGYPSKYSSCLSFIDVRYHTWSSRIIIEAIIYNLIVHPTTWKILNILIMLLLLHSILKITDSLKIYWIKYIALVLILLIPTTVLYEVGFIVTSINYLWTTTLSLYGLSVIVDLIKGKKISTRKGILYLLASFIGFNSEQMEAVAGITLFVSIIYFTNKYNTSDNNAKAISQFLKQYWILFVEFLLSFLSLIFIATCPGNEVRYTLEMSRWFPAYASYSVLEKIQIGITSTFKMLVIIHNDIFIIYTICIFITSLIFVHFEKIIHKKLVVILSAIILISSIYVPAIKFLHVDASGIVNRINLFTQDILIMPSNNFSMINFLIIVGYVLIIVMILLINKLLFPNSIKSLALNYFVMIGLFTRLIMGFSPTVFASRTRTFLPLYIFLIVSIIFYLKEIRYCFSQKN